MANGREGNRNNIAVMKSLFGLSGRFMFRSSHKGSVAWHECSGAPLTTTIQSKYINTIKGKKKRYRIGLQCKQTKHQNQP